MPLPLVPSSRHGVYPQVPALRHGAGHHGRGDLCHRAQHPLPHPQYPRAVRGSQEGKSLSKVGSQGLARRGGENDEVEGDVLVAGAVHRDVGVHIDLGGPVDYLPFPVL